MSEGGPPSPSEKCVCEYVGGRLPGVEASPKRSVDSSSSRGAISDAPCSKPSVPAAAPGALALAAVSLRSRPFLAFPLPEFPS